MRFNKIFIACQILFILIGIASITAIAYKTFKRFPETTECLSFTAGYIIILSGLFLSLVLSIFMIKIEKRFVNPFLYTPIIFLFAFFFLWGSYQLGYIRIYEYEVGKTPSQCDWLVNILSPPI